jgi:hypothetical protein
MDVPLAMYRDEIEAYKEAMCRECAAECEEAKKKRTKGLQHMCCRPFVLK